MEDTKLLRASFQVLCSAEHRDFTAAEITAPCWWAHQQAASGSWSLGILLFHSLEKKERLLKEALKAFPSFPKFHSAGAKEGRPKPELHDVSDLDPIMDVLEVDIEHQFCLVFSLSPRGEAAGRGSY